MTVPVTTPVSTAAPSPQLGAFLRAHRELLRPGDVGLTATARRRTPGLRREEVASLSGVGLAWYTWLEQGRVTASRQVLAALARTLRLDPVEVRHAMRLAGHHEPASPAGDGDAALAPVVQPVLDAWPASPAVLLDRHFDVLAWNSAWAALWGSPGEVAPCRRNLLWLMAADERLHTVLPDWVPLAMNVFQHFRAQAGAALSEDRTAQVYRALEEDVPELSHWWGCRSVAELTARTLTVRPPGGGAMDLSLSSFHPVDDPSALILLFTPPTAADRARMNDLVAG
ncbi:helix-turn-helix transcriptional regulator [Actinacidiphila paucisporea]|uniref:Transcriptional regulator, XRE family n=1 Tax=Actinacidiphila paucisporea TaxID=310782 RepID=A0A1M7PSX9_9ACTN|nr:helix-turn-helix transcriptional regulator [Actinacidiphila paucisporea]SHN20573.1 transcriptional regulator, XRE family [Actinacidiphila paucisporea]